MATPARIVQVANTNSVKRQARNPVHTFNVKHKPFVLQPFMIAPVLPGETMTNLSMQARVVTDPIKNKLTGWHQEYWFFYVKLRDLEAQAAVLESMILENDASIASIEDAVADPNYYHYSGLNYAKMCLQQVVDKYMRDEGEAFTPVSIDGMPTAQLMQKSWLDSVYDNAELPTDTIDGDPALPIDEFERKYNTWLKLRNEAMTEMSFEDYLGTFGVRTGLQAKNKPELIRYIREWSYPSNTVDPATGIPTSAVSWSISERADKDRFFAEPGFIFGVTCGRPKLYLSQQRESATHLLRNNLNWLPAVMRDSPETSLVEVAEGSGPLGGVNYSGTGSYWVDIRDLFVYGDQFSNVLSAGGTVNAVALPVATNSLSRYPTEMMVDSLFTDDGDPADVNQYIRQDGIVQLRILSHQTTAVDQT